ncbi:hypothetical protein BU204_27150 [Actinophytocola xanthii]|uniref:Uncharacterized protein n=1 Tax=Actinophytocola xanthii TaxID=1912961 RepID=A0A1Q8CGJ6_9PSEU|nr:hypothetical protein BU204_27150 [Actinophytocola xanthii]
MSQQRQAASLVSLSVAGADAEVAQQQIDQTRLDPQARAPGRIDDRFTQFTRRHRANQHLAVLQHGLEVGMVSTLRIEVRSQPVHHQGERLLPVGT